MTAVLEHLVAQHADRFLIETHTPVTAVTTIIENACDRRFVVHTTRGIVQARHVIHCTNAHVGHLVPSVRGNIYPVRGQMSAQRSSPIFPHQGDNRSWIFSYDKGFDYLTQLPLDEFSNGEMMLGGGFVQSEGGGVEDVGISSDDQMSRCVEAHLYRTLRDVFDGQYWGDVDQEVQESNQMWTGTMGFSVDGLPWVGRIPESTTTSEQATKQGSEWIVAGFSGEGMVQAWLCSKALVVMLSESDLVEQRSSGLVWFPKQMIVTNERLQEARLARQVAPN